MYSYDNVTLVPRVISEIPTRDNCDTSVTLGTVYNHGQPNPTQNVVLDVPIISSPMPDVTGADMAFTLRRSGVLGIIHRFQTIEGQLKEFIGANSIPETASWMGRFDKGAVGCAIGVTDDFSERFDVLHRAGCRIFCLDTANGANTQVEHAFKTLQSKEISYYCIAGNVATWEGYQFLANLGVNAVRVGIAGGSVCETKIETGVYMPTLECVREIAEYVDHEYGNELPHPLIIADGGIRTPADMAKALAVGADLIMGGRIFAGYRETPGPIIKDRHDKQLYKLYRGAASHGVQKDTNGEKPDYSEGAEELVPFIDKSASTVIKRFKNGFRSTMSYMNATTIPQFRQNVRVEKL
jgi:IMP dehydrogenase